MLTRILRTALSATAAQLASFGRSPLPCNLRKAARPALAIALSSLLIACGKTASFPKESETALSQNEKIERYLQTADHLTREQKELLASGRPFIGMTLEEANLAMRQESADLGLGGKILRAVYVGGKGTKYYLYFEGSPPRVVHWSYFSGDEFKLRDPSELHPFPPTSR